MSSCGAAVGVGVSIEGVGAGDGFGAFFLCAGDDAFLASAGVVGASAGVGDTFGVGNNGSGGGEIGAFLGGFGGGILGVEGFGLDVGVIFGISGFTGEEVEDENFEHGGCRIMKVEEELGIDSSASKGVINSNSLYSIPTPCIWFQAPCIQFQDLQKVTYSSDEPCNANISGESITLQDVFLKGSGRSEPGGGGGFVLNLEEEEDLRLELVFVNEVEAIGIEVRTACQARRLWQEVCLQVDLNEQMKYMLEELVFQVYNGPTPPSPMLMNKYSLGATRFVPFVPSGGTSSSRGSKHKAPMIDLIESQFDKLTTRLDGFMDFIGPNNSHFEKISSMVEH
ncbi:hypothetical protein LR48_Vigan05g131900 [Vigna angularis]|uniref:Uncharacterized protein n=1 Tax=Phaseolus angularis TaxID=3914 RepID=A0A0L9UME4_PHAAN|nr:hypothetical protein LR48_Vigan05g131900 [Vigna angularis]